MLIQEYFTKMIDTAFLPTFQPEELEFLIAVLNTPRSKPQSTCTVPRCYNVSRRRGLCQLHGGRRRCKIEGCEKRDQKRGFCAKHGGADPCSINGCTNVARVAQRCAKHRHGFEMNAYSRNHNRTINLM